jgi:hypothetical protein
MPQEELLLSVVVATAICTLLLSLLPERSQDYAVRPACPARARTAAQGVAVPPQTHAVFVFTPAPLRPSAAKRCSCS